jgi:predicted transcriptional regulator
MHRANLSRKLLNYLLDPIIEQDLISIKKEGQNTLYGITEKGKNSLSVCQK